MILNPIHLKTFLVVCEKRSFTRASETLHLSQPAVSRQIQQLQQGLGVELFERIGKTLHVTDAGQTLAAEAENVLGVLKRAAESVTSHRAVARGVLRVAASTTPGFYILPTLLRRFQTAYPDVELSFRVEDSGKVESLLVRNEIDIGFVGEERRSGALALKRAFDDEIVCFAGPSHPFAKRKRISATVLSREVCVTRSPGSATRRLFDEWLSSAGGNLEKTIEVHCSEAAKVIVAAGLGFSFMSILGLRRELNDGIFVRLPVSRLKLHRPIYLAEHSDKRRSPVVTAFLESIGGPQAR